MQRSVVNNKSNQNESFNSLVSANKRQTNSFLKRKFFAQDMSDRRQLDDEKQIDEAYRREQFYRDNSIMSLDNSVVQARINYCAEANQENQMFKHS